MTPVLQLLVFVAAIICLVAFGFYRDKKEHAPSPDADGRQREIYFPEPQDAEHHRGAAMSRIR